MLDFTISQYTLTIIPVTGLPVFDYFFTIVFWFGFIAWGVSLPIRLLR